MKKRMAVLASALGLFMALSIPATAVDLHEPHTNMSFDCDGIVTLHFVWNQTPGYAGGSITVNLNDGGTILVEAPDKVLKSVTHYYVDIDGSDVLTDASVPGSGNLVLSHYECTPDKKKK